MELSTTKLLLRAAAISRTAQHSAMATLAAAQENGFADLYLNRLDPDRFAHDIGVITGFSLCCEMAGDYATADQLSGLANELRSALHLIKAQALQECLASLGVTNRKEVA